MLLSELHLVDCGLDALGIESFRLDLLQDRFDGVLDLGTQDVIQVRIYTNALSTSTLSGNIQKSYQLHVVRTDALQPDRQAARPRRV